MQSNAEWNAERRRLEQQLIGAALNLLKFSKAESFSLPIPDTSPPLLIRVGPVPEPLDDMGE